jgi:hypothetical protein
MTFEAGAWVAGGLGAVAGLAASRLSATPLTGSGKLVDGGIGAVVGVVLALLAYGVLSLFEAWSAFFQRRASPGTPLVLTAAMLAGWVMVLWVRGRRRRP